MYMYQQRAESRTKKSLDYKINDLFYCSSIFLKINIFIYWEKDNSISSTF